MRQNTDPRTVRWQEVQRLIDILQAEPGIAQVTIAPFSGLGAKTSIAWLPKHNPGAIFFNIGQGVTDPADYKELTALIHHST